MEWKLWAAALNLALLKAWLDLFHGGMEGEGAWKLRGVIPKKGTHSPMRISEHVLSPEVERIPFPLATGGDTESSLPITVVS